MSINDLEKMDLTPFIWIFGIVAVIVLVCYYSALGRAKSDYNNSEEKTESGLKVVSKDMGDLINIGGTVAAPIKGYRCTFVFERSDGSRLVLKTSNADIYDALIIGDVGKVRYKNSVLTGFTRSN